MIYVMSDIHGNERRFSSVMRQINLQPEDTLYILGDVIDRHPGGIRILRTIMSMPNARMLLGNHEYMMLRALGCPYDDNWDDGGALEHWYRNGGQVTHDDWKRLQDEQRGQIVEYLRALPLQIDIAVNGTAFQLVHGAPAKAYSSESRYKNAVHYAVWKRLDPFDRFPGTDILVFGHTPTIHYQDTVPMALWYGEHKVGIDCGSGYPEEGPEGQYGRLACLRLDDGTVFYSEEDCVPHGGHGGSS